MEDKYKHEHSRTIIHVDMDCFYAQVEMVKNPSLSTRPLGIQQKNIVVTSNYVAREYGIKKCMLVSDALKVCPELVLVNGEDLHDYRQVSYKVTALLQTYSALVERLGLDENFVDVTELVNKEVTGRVQDFPLFGNVYGESSDSCQCGCEDRLKVGTKIAQNMRDAIKKEFNLTCCAGIAHNKLLAKLVGSTHKPNQQTVIYPNAALELMLSLKSVRQIPGIGKATADALENINVTTVEDLQNCDVEKIVLTGVKGNVLKELSIGVDLSPVKSSGKPQSIGLEDSCKTITVESEVREKLQQLLTRLVILIREDGRMPKAIKVTVRKFDKISKMSHRETKQCNIDPSLFSTRGTSQISSESLNRLMTVVMHLFKKIININKPYHITLLGLSCTKFKEQPRNNNLLTNFLRKSLEVQSVTSIESKEHRLSLPLDIENNLSGTDNSDFEPEVEPTPKKIRLTSLISRKSYLGNDDCSSPSKLNVAELRLTAEKENGNNGIVYCPPTADTDVFEELPRDVQKELWEDYKRERDRTESLCQSQKKKPKVNTLLNYFVKN